MTIGAWPARRPAPDGRRRVGLLRLTVTAALLLAGLFLLGSIGCSDAQQSGGEGTLSTGTTSTTSSNTTAGETVTTSVPIGELGVRRNPIPVGQEFQVGDWQVKVRSATLDATQAILDENMFNDAPEPGYQYVLIEIEATYGGGDSSTFWVDMMYMFVGSRGDTFDSGTAMAPDSIINDDAVSAGGSVSGNLVFLVASDQVAGGTLLLEELSSLDESGTFFAIQ